jgi:hypothetical protein
VTGTMKNSHGNDIETDARVETVVVIDVQEKFPVGRVTRAGAPAAKVSDQLKRRHNAGHSAAACWSVGHGQPAGPSSEETLNMLRLILGWLFRAGLTAAATYFAMDEVDQRVSLARSHLHEKFGLARYARAVAPKPVPDPKPSPPPSPGPGVIPPGRRVRTRRPSRRRRVRTGLRGPGVCVPTSTLSRAVRAAIALTDSMRRTHTPRYVPNRVSIPAPVPRRDMMTFRARAAGSVVEIEVRHGSPFG